jgi:ATP-dependent Clp protease ATP-binding subunit ClpC
VVDFRNSVLIMTSNLGTEFVRRSGSLGFLQSRGDSEERAEHEKIEKELKKTFRPEFLNRIDEIITFSPLSVEQMGLIVDLQMKEVQERLGERGLNVVLTPASREWLAREGFDPAFGARPLRRALQKHVESPLSVALLAGEYSEGETIVVDVDVEQGKLVFRQERQTVPAEEFGQVPVEN